MPLSSLAPIVAVRGTIVVDVNGLALAELAAPAEVIVGADLAALVVEGDRDLLVQLVGGADPAVATVVRLAIDGDVRHVELRAEAEDDLVLVSVRDRTEERLLHAVLDALADTTLLLDPSGLVRWQSRTVREQMQGGPDAGIGINPMERIHPEDLPAVLDASAARAGDAGQPDPPRAPGPRAVEDDDSWQLVEMLGVNAIDDPDVGAFIVQVRDLAEAEEVESLAGTEGQFLSLADAAPMGIIVSDLLGRTTYRNEAARELLDQPELRPDRDWRELARGRSWRTELEALHRAVVDRREPGSITAAFDVAGTIRWIRVHVAPGSRSAPATSTSSPRSRTSPPRSRRGRRPTGSPTCSTPPPTTWRCSARAARSST